ncbi:hypothetical protein [Desulfonatronum thioautotrophicum]|uniref:hypothetical protein n=1 Tax=Desulfonatronum thioautotrophicum TaxID=617001 RepID=UPI0005EB2B92|nr:hypothetical protein [Desulfonatronum thioautotrophicum]
MHPVLETVLAFAGMLGVVCFAVGKLLTRSLGVPIAAPGYAQVSLYFGLMTWTILFLLRHDVVTVVGLLLAMALLYRRHRHLARINTCAVQTDKSATPTRS